MSKTNNFVFTGLLILAWIIFVGLCIEAGALLVNFFFSMFNPDVVQNLYEKMDMTDLYANSPMVFFGVYGFILTISILKAYLFFVVVMLMHKMDLSKPFDQFVSSQISKISYLTLSIGLFSYIGREVTSHSAHYGLVTDRLNQFWADPQAFILMGGIIYIIAVIFKKGVDLQHENDLTV